MTTPLTRTLWCLDCGEEISALPQSQRESGALLAICPPCAIKRIQKAEDEKRKRQDEAIREEARSERVARNYEATMRRNIEERKKREQEEEQDPTYIEEGGAIQWAHR